MDSKLYDSIDYLYKIEQLIEPIKCQNAIVLLCSALNWNFRLKYHMDRLWKPWIYLVKQSEKFWIEVIFGN